MIMQNLTDRADLGNEVELAVAQAVANVLSAELDYIRLYHDDGMVFMVPLKEDDIFVTVLELFTHVNIEYKQRGLNRKVDFPFSAVTQSHLKMHEGWHIDERSLHLLTGGKIEDEGLGRLYASRQNRFSGGLGVSRLFRVF